MSKAKRNRRIGSIKTELLRKSRESSLAAVQIFNNPNITFKSESYVVLMIIAWTYLMHAYYKSHGIEYRYHRVEGNRRKFDRTKRGAFKFWELERCLNDKSCPLDGDTKNNLRFLVGLRHEIEHQMTTRIDDLLSARLQACCLNFNHYIRDLFGDKYSIDKHLSFSLQFANLNREQVDLLEEHDELPSNIQAYIQDFDSALSKDEFDNERYAYRILFVPKTANRVGQADRVIEFVRSDSPLAHNVNRDLAVIRETERKKYLPGVIVKLMQTKGFVRFNMHHHTELWKAMDAKKEGKGYGVAVATGHWYWYETWVQEVEKHCRSNRGAYV